MRPQQGGDPNQMQYTRNTHSASKINEIASLHSCNGKSYLPRQADSLSIAYLAFRVNNSHDINELAEISQKKRDLEWTFMNLSVSLGVRGSDRALPFLDAYFSMVR